ncbi:MAG: DUF3048 domain-containing protein, partial [Actinobacteria bacterium]|nr:DUF3048 domain-containing protein [Actinomycetota bacterium]
MRTITRLVALGLIVTACSGEAEPAETTSTTEPTTTTTTVPATTTTAAPTTTVTETANLSPINGMPVDDPQLLERRVLAVKIDNHPKARPQSGIEQADMVIEALVEGITRFISVWHQSDAEYLGPMRSGRPTDSTLLPAFNSPTFAISGAQGWVQQMIRSKGIPLIKELSPGTFRIGGRRAPHNLYVNTIELRAHADNQGYPNDPPTQPIWEFGPMPADAATASSIRIDFSGNTVQWTWDAGEGLWLRSTSGSESNWRNLDGETGRIGIPVLVALYTEQYTVNGLPTSQTVG